MSFPRDSIFISSPSEASFRNSEKWRLASVAVTIFILRFPTDVVFNTTLAGAIRGRQSFISSRKTSRLCRGIMKISLARSPSEHHHKIPLDLHVVPDLSFKL